MSFFKKDFIYLFMRETERERQRHRQREKQAPRREPDLRLNPRFPGSRPGLKAVLKCWAMGAAPEISFWASFPYLTPLHPLRIS